MQAKEFSLLLNYLSLSKVRVPILETYAFSDDICKKKFFNNSQGYVETSNHRIGGIYTILVILLKDYEKTAKLKPIGKNVCYVVTSKERKLLSQQSIRKILKTSKKDSLGIIYIQKLQHHCDDSQLFYTLNLNLHMCKYHSEMLININGSINKCKDTTILTTTRDIASIAVSAIEKSQQFPVESISFEFVKDDYNNLYIRSMKLTKYQKLINEFPLKRLESIIIRSPRHSEAEKIEQSIIHLTTRNERTLRKSHTLNPRKALRAKTDKVQKRLLYKKHQIASISNSAKSSSLSDMESSSLEEEKDSNFLEILARERVKQKNVDIGKIGKITPDNDMLLKEMKSVKKDMSSVKIPIEYLQATKNIRKTMPAINFTGKLQPILRHSLKLL